MFKPGGQVYHDEYGMGEFISVSGKEVKLASVRFEERGLRRFTLPSRRLRPIRQYFAEEIERKGGDIGIGNASMKTASQNAG